MSLMKEIGITALELGVAAAITTGVITGVNFYVHDNVNYEINGKRVFQKADGISSYTELVINKDNSKEIKKNSIINTKYYEDQDNDKEVDRFIQWYHPFHKGPSHREFDKEKLEKNPEILREVNEDFNEQLKRFNLENKVK